MLRMPVRAVIAAMAIGLILAPAAYAEVVRARVDRTGPDALSITWNDTNAVNVYQVDGPAGRPDRARPLAAAVANGRLDLPHAGLERRYFVLEDAVDRRQVEVAERVLPLAQGSNFRDIGGYVGAGGKHVRWGAIYRSAGQPLLTPEDLASLSTLHLTQMVDLRSSEERVIAPSRISGVPYAAVGYSIGELLPRTGTAGLRNGADVYRNFPTLLAPQLKIIFAHLLGSKGPLVYNCSAGQDRTGFVTAILLTALGVDRDTIVEDYHLSTQYRRPEFEMPLLDAAAHPNEPVFQLFAQAQQRPNWKTAEPLKSADGRPYLDGAFAEIDAKWGSVDGYLKQAIGLSPQDLERLRRTYLE
jgi:protein-tyrosine phosphatase